MSKDVSPTPAVPGAMAMTEEAIRVRIQHLMARAEQTANECNTGPGWEHRTRITASFTFDYETAKVLEGLLAELTRLRAQVREGEKVRAEALEEAARVREAAAACLEVLEPVLEINKGTQESLSGCQADECFAMTLKLAAAIVQTQAALKVGRFAETALTPRPAPTEGGKG